MAIRRAVNGNADLSGNYRLWVANLHEPTQPSRYSPNGPQDPDSYPPITYALYAPFGLMPLWLTALIWYAINLGCSYWLFQLGRRAIAVCEDETMGGSSGERSCLVFKTVKPDANFATLSLIRDQQVGDNSSSRQNESPITGFRWGRSQAFDIGIVTLASVVVLPFWIGTILLGQATLLIMLLVVLSFQFASRRPALAGVLLAFATMMKVLPVVFILPFLIRKNLKLLLAFVLTGLLTAGGLGTLYFGAQVNLIFNLRWLELALHGPTDLPPDPAVPQTLRGSIRYNNQSIEAVLARLLVQVPLHPQAGSMQVNLTRWHASTWRMLKTVVTGLCAALVVMTLLLNESRRRSELRSNEGVATDPWKNDLVPMAAMCLLQMFISPLVWSHYYVWLFWPLLLITRSAFQGETIAKVLLICWGLAVPCIGSVFLRSIGLHLWLCVAFAIWMLFFTGRQMAFRQAP